LLARSALLVLSSDYEGLPNVVLEAMAARLPVITTPAGDAGVVVQHGQTGFVVQPDDHQSMAACMVKLAQSPSLRAELGKAGRQRVEQEYNYESLADRLVEIFRSFASQEQRTALVELLERHAPDRKSSDPALILGTPPA
jgi:glycosyltransferase involved in cell wall biosynthesis